MPSNHLILCHPLLLLSSIFPSIRVFSNSQFFTSGGQSIGVSTSAMNIQCWLPLGLTGWISLQSKGLQESSPAPQFEASILWRSAFFMVQFSHLYMTAGKTIALIIWTVVSKVVSLLFNILCRFVIKNSTFKKLISWHRVHHFMANRWGNSGNSDRLYFLGLQNHCRWWLQPWN